MYRSSITGTGKAFVSSP